ncbi:MAG TPA: hypothetical protein VEF76_00800 [Patescibacteria group bacterium]|nr:hypothetical protein [Patescibacteria group bacterium]
MKFEQTNIWNDPLVQKTRNAVSIDLDALNAVPAVKALIAADALDPVTAAGVMAASGTVKGAIDARVADVISLLESPKLRGEGPDYLFKADDCAALKIIMGTLIAETTGVGFQKTLSQAEARKGDVQKGIDMMAQIADLLVETGAHNAIEPKLVEQFIDGLDNMKQLAGYASRRTMVNEASASLKYAMMQGTANDVTYHAPRIDPDSQYAALKHVARGKLRL